MSSPVSSVMQKVRSLSGLLFRFLHDNSTLLIGEILLKEKVISPAQLQKALEVQKKTRLKLCQVIVQENYATEEEVLRAINNYYALSLTSLSENIEAIAKRRRNPLQRLFSNLYIPIRVKLSIAITFIIWLTILVLSFVILARQREQLYLQTVKTGKVTLNYITNNANIPLLNDDTLRLNALIKEAVSIEGILYAVIIDHRNMVKAHTDLSKIGTTLAGSKNASKATRDGDIVYYNDKIPSGPDVLNLTKPVTFMKKDLGTVHVGLSLDFIKQQIRKETLSIILLSLLIVVLGITISILLGFSFSRPISDLVVATREIGKGNFQYRIGAVRRDELGDLAKAFNYMSQELWKKLLMQKSFGRYVSPEVLDIILANPEESWLKGTRNEATVLFADIRGFTAYAETREPEEVVEALNEYFTIASEFILRYGGYVDKFIGDAVLGVFCIPVTRDDHAERAVRAAVAMQEELHKPERQRNVLLSRIGIGINSGVLVSGNLGSQVKMEYTVIGDNVNVASRIVGIAGPGDIIISKSTHERTKDLVAVKALPPQKVKGKTEPVEIFQILEIREPSRIEQGV